MANDNKCLARKVRWLGLVESDLFGDAHRLGIEVTCADRDAGAGIAIDPELFSGAPAEVTISAEDLDSITDARSAYPSLTPERFHAAGLRWMAYRLAGSFANLQQKWLSMLLVPGTMVRNAQLGMPPGLVLLSSQYFAVIWHVSIMSSPGGVVVSLLLAGEKVKQPFQLLQVSDLGPEWQILVMKGISPRASQEMFGAASGFQLSCNRVRTSIILEVAATNCFKGCTVPLVDEVAPFRGYCKRTALGGASLVSRIAQACLGRSNGR